MRLQTCSDSVLVARCGSSESMSPYRAQTMSLALAALHASPRAAAAIATVRLLMQDLSRIALLLADWRRRAAGGMPPSSGWLPTSIPGHEIHRLPDCISRSALAGL